jgi:N-acetylneuraminic acid mutarotase
MFTDHYMFDPHTLTFSTIPSGNGLPALYGHASVIFPDGRMFVFGGVSEDILNPLSNVWTLDTNNINPAWEKMPVDSSSLPQPRRAFAAVAIGQGKILMQGGSDANLQNNMNDGWVLDTSKDPAVWTQVAELTQLGARRDHYAILSNGLVIFGFGRFFLIPIFSMLSDILPGFF